MLYCTYKLRNNAAEKLQNKAQSLGGRGQLTAQSFFQCFLEGSWLAGSAPQF